MEICRLWAGKWQGAEKGAVAGVTEMHIEVMKGGLETASVDVNISGGPEVSAALTPFPWPNLETRVIGNSPL